MPLEWGAHTLGATQPAGYLQDGTQEIAIDTATIRSSDGAIVYAISKPRQLKTTTLRTKGEFSLLVVPMGDHGSSQFINSAKVSETNDDFSVSEVTYLQFS
jgi:hypothetical protein